MQTINQVRETHPLPTQKRLALIPPVDLVEDAGGITLYADLPGVGKEQLQLHVDGEQLTIEGEAVLPESEALTTLHAEVTRRLYRRSFRLSKELDAERIAAEMSQGSLRVRIPKALHAQPRRVEVQAV